MTSHVRLTVASAAAALALPATASAASLTAASTCAVGGNAMPISGTGFTPNTKITLTTNTGGSGSVTSDATGAFSTTVTAPTVHDFTAHTLTITATDTTNPALAAGTQFGVVKGPFETNFPVNGKPRQRVLWQFAGFVTGKPIYVHLRFKGRTMANYRFGVASGPCGTLRAHAKRLPAKPRYGTWSMQFDQVPRFNRFTKPRRVLGVTIYRRVG